MDTAIATKQRAGKPPETRSEYIEPQPVIVYN
jgi:hypothetical protein